MLAASGCHKDSFNFDEFTRPTTTNSDDGTPRTPNIRISSTDRTAQEGSGQIVLMINSDDDAPAGGLAVMITIAGAMAGEFTANAPATCTANLVCTVRILEGNRVGNLVLMPTSDSAMENSEEWTASLVDGGSNYNFAANNNVAFDITDPTTPGPMIPSLPVVGIATGDMPVEDGAGVTLTITSSEIVPAALTDGLSVTINIVGADANDFNNAVCTNLVCIVTIPAGSNSVSLILSPLSDFSTESERWTATLVDDDDNDYDLAANFNVGFDIDDLIAAIGIATGDMPIEDGAGVTLTITSDETVPATLIGGLSVTINIVGADAADFNNAVCTNLVCIVTIPAGSNSVSLILSPLSDFSTETGERWTATLVNGDDYNLDAGNNNVGFDITDLIAAVGIATSDAVMEGNAVVLTITSSIAAPASGLTVTINIGVADATEFTSGTPPQCNGLVCEVVIAATEMSAELTLTALSGDESENVEMWTATIEPDTAIFNVDPANDDATFDITNLPLPAAANLETLANLNAYDLPTDLAANAIRNLQSNAIDGVAITASLYEDASGMPQVYVQMLEFAALGIWVNGNTPAINGVDHDFDYAFLGDNVVSTLPNSGAARYDIEGDATYRGVNFFPDGNLNMDFAMNSFSGSMGVSGAFGPDHFGSATAMVPDLDDLDADGDTAELRPIASTDIWQINLIGDIDSDGFTSMPNISGALGFFADLSSGAPATGNTMAGRFYDAAGYNPASGDPSEIAGAGIIVDSDGTGDVHFGFVGRCTLACTP